jgi:hypothetical protein
MAKTFTAPFSQTQQTAVAIVTSAYGSENTLTPSNTSLLLTAGSEGCLVTSITFLPRQSSISASNVKLWLSKDSGTSKYQIDSALAAAQTVYTYAATTVGSFELITETPPLRLSAGDELYVGCGNAVSNGLAFFAEYMDF